MLKQNSCKIFDLLPCSHDKLIAGLTPDDHPQDTPLTQIKLELTTLITKNEEDFVRPWIMHNPSCNMVSAIPEHNILDSEWNGCRNVHK
ncbi:Uncharacterized protein HZ326_22775 [Fusarium oxysporum f. sp. albedinis]|nr:Uncharacterized protein HZ326_22775 [Fusarium oxysporum f. sp. albedinis]